MSKAAAYAVFDPKSPFRPFAIERREPGPRDVQIDILHCGICHSDLHTARGEWAGTTYPCVPGHEIVGRVSRIGRDVRGFQVGGLAGVGCMVGSCGGCASCVAGLEQYCDEGAVKWTYNSPDEDSPAEGKVTYGGYSNRIVVDERFCLRIPEKLALPAVAPLLCAGITMYSPLRHWGAGTDRAKTVGIVGLGGLGHMGVKLSHALGARTVLFTTSPGKAEDAKRLGADEVVVSKDARAMHEHAASLDLIIDTVAVPHDLDAYTSLLRRDGTLVLVGVPEHPHPSPKVGALIGRRRAIGGSLIGGIRETQEMLEFCGARGIVSDIESIPIQKVDEAYERMLRSDVKYRFVIDMSSLA